MTTCIKNPRIKDMVGRTFRRLTVIRYAGIKARYAMWLCQCECGKQVVVNGSELRRTRGRRTWGTGSCGCLQQDTAPNLVHGHSSRRGITAEYAAWTTMLGRCVNPNNASYERYGGRGIVVCQRWRESFENFLHDMGPKPSPEHSVDRIDNDGNYEPGNCRWATCKEQARNRRGNKLLTFNSETLTQSEWAERTGINIGTLKWRLKVGWTIEDALTRPVGRALE